MKDRAWLGAIAAAAALAGCGGGAGNQGADVEAMATHEEQVARDSQTPDLPAVESAIAGGAPDGAAVSPALLHAAAAVQPSATVQSVLFQADFEGPFNQLGPGWRVNYWGNPSPSFKAWRETATANARGSVSQGYRVNSSPAGGGAHLIHSHAFKKDQKYRLALWLKASVPTTAAVQLRRDAHPWNVFAGGQDLALTTSWQRFEIEGTYRWNEVGSIRLVPKATGVSLYMDDVVLSEESPAGSDPLGLSPCQPSGLGKDYQVGPNPGQLPSIADVPWESLQAGDTVRFFHRAEPYVGKFILAAQGTQAAPVRVCGVKGPNGERPVILGAGAATRAKLANTMGGQGSQAQPYNESRGVVFISRNWATEPWQSYPRHLRIDGLRIQGAHPRHAFHDSFGARRNYMEFGACIWLDRGHDISIVDNEITDCSQGLYSRSSDDGDYSVTKNLRIAGNIFTDNGIVGGQGMHSAYTASDGVVYEYNRFGPLRAGATGNSIKDRSVGTVVRYNRIEDGARAIDLVEAEDFPNYALSKPAYRSTFVYGNQIVKDGRKGSTIHYGGDHNGSTPGATWGEDFNRKGTLYFFNNTVRLTGDGYAVLFQLSTTQEKAEVWNNVFVFDPAIPHPRMRSATDVGAAWTSGGIVNLGRNWIDARWSDGGPWHTVPGQLNGTGNLITGTTPPVDIDSFVPLAGGPAVDGATPAPGSAAAAVAPHPVAWQLNGGLRPMPRTVSGAAPDLGAVERPAP